MGGGDKRRVMSKTRDEKQCKWSARKDRNWPPSQARAITTLGPANDPPISYYSVLRKYYACKGDIPGDRWVLYMHSPVNRNH